MKSAIIAAIFIAAPSLALAQDAANLPATYLEIGAGGSFIQTVSTQTYTLTSGTTTATGKIKLNYSPGFTTGVELGMAGLISPEFRFAVAYDYIQGRFDTGNVVGTVNGTAGSFPFTRNDITSVGASLDTDANIVTGNAYYSFPLIGNSIRPYVGVGVGAAMLNNAGSEPAFTATLGARTAISDNAYVGVRYRFYYINGPTDDAGIKYDAVTIHSAMALLGFYLN